MDGRPQDAGALGAQRGASLSVERRASGETTVATNRPPSLRSANGPASALATPAGLGAGCPPPSTPSTGPGAGTSGASGAGEPGAAVGGLPAAVPLGGAAGARPVPGAALPPTRAISSRQPTAAIPRRSHRSAGTAGAFSDRTARA